MPHFPVDALHVEHPAAYALVAQQRPPTQEALAHQSLDEQGAPADRLLLAEHLNSLLRKWVDSQLLHLPVEAQAVSAQLGVQQWLFHPAEVVPPLQMALTHQSLDEQVAPAAFFAEHLKSAVA